MAETKPATCDKCGIEARAVSGKRHRRCPGKNVQKDASTGKTLTAPRPKHDKLPIGARGIWA